MDHHEAWNTISQSSNNSLLPIRMAYQTQLLTEQHLYMLRDNVVGTCMEMRKRQHPRKIMQLATMQYQQYILRSGSSPRARPGSQRRLMLPRHSVSCLTSHVRDVSPGGPQPTCALESNYTLSTTPTTPICIQYVP